MRSPDLEGAFVGQPPQDLLHDLSEFRKGFMRISPEHPAVTIRRLSFDPQLQKEDARPQIKGELVIFDGALRFPWPFSRLGLSIREKAERRALMGIAQDENEAIVASHSLLDGISPIEAETIGSNEAVVRELQAS